MKGLSFSMHKYDSAVIDLIREVKTGLDKTHEILGQIRIVQVAHGGITRQVSVPEVLDTQMELHKVDLAVDIDLYLNTDVNKFALLFYRMWEEFAAQSEKAFFEIISLTTEATGNSVDAKGQSFWDARVEMLDGLEMRFDEEGNHDTQLVLDLDTIEKLKANPQTPEQQKRWEDALAAKREAYYAQKRTRRLS